MCEGMRFLVERTSMHSHDLKPCDEAVQGPYIREDVRTVDDPTKIQIKGNNGDWWYKEGTNHRTIQKGKKTKWIVRDFPETRWYVELATMDDLLQFIGKYGDCIVGTAFDNSDVMSIEIYDGYRE